MELQLQRRLSIYPPISIFIDVPQPLLFRHFRVAAVERVTNSIFPRMANVSQGSILFLTIGEMTIAFTQQMQGGN